MRSVIAPLLLAAMALAAPARAELGDDSNRLLESWRSAGATAERRNVMFLQQGEGADVALPALERGWSGCTTVLVLGERPLDFVLERPRNTLSAAAARDGTPGAAPLPGSAPDGAEAQNGLARLEDCSDAQALWSSAHVTMGSPRGTLEVLIARHHGKLPAAEQVLPERAVGPVAPRWELGEPLRPGPAAERVARAEAAARLDGAALVAHVPTRASEQGWGSLRLRFGEGCHRVSVISELAAPARDDEERVELPLDVDAELRHAGPPGQDEAVRRDRSHAPDARLDFCLGEPSELVLRYVGAAAAADVTLLDAQWPLPAGVPARWGAQTRAHFGAALHRRRAPAVREEPLYEALGGPGLTELPVELEPDACYLAATALSRGEAAAGRLAARVGGRRYHDDMGEDPAGAVAFCAEGERLATLAVDLHARSAGWVIALWRMGGAP